MLVRPEGRTLRVARTIASRWQPSFNARPPRRTDATPQLRIRRGCAHIVSMLVRPEGRTLHDLETGDTFEFPSFQCSSAPKDGRYLPPNFFTVYGLNFRVSMLVRPEGRTLLRQKIRLYWLQRFQCSSAPKDGRYLLAHCRSSCVVSFNARPPRRTDATLHFQQKVHALQVFQCSSAPKDGRYATPFPPNKTAFGFNARPPRRTDATQQQQVPVQHRLVVSMLVRPEGRTLHL